MAVYSVKQKYLTDNYAVVVLVTNADPLEVGQSVVIAGVDATFNGTYTVRALPQYLYTGVDSDGDLLYDINIPIQNQAFTQRPLLMSLEQPPLAHLQLPRHALGSLLGMSRTGSVSEPRQLETPHSLQCARQLLRNFAGDAEWKQAMWIRLRPSLRKMYS